MPNETHHIFAGPRPRLFGLGFVLASMIAACSGSDCGKGCGRAYPGTVVGQVVPASPAKATSGLDGTVAVYVRRNGHLSRANGAVIGETGTFKLLLDPGRAYLVVVHLRSPGIRCPREDLSVTSRETRHLKITCA